jgi:hypothetical protein
VTMRWRFEYRPHCRWWSVIGAGERASIRFLEFFASNIRNANTRQSYARAVPNHASTRTTQRYDRFPKEIGAGKLVDRGTRRPCASSPTRPTF